MNTHTPGPWRVIQNWHGKIAVVNGKTRVANAPHMDITKMEKKLGREAALEATTGMANARLIAAAPDMLIGAETSGRYAYGDVTTKF